MEAMRLTPLQTLMVNNSASNPSSNNNNGMRLVQQPMQMMVPTMMSMPANFATMPRPNLMTATAQGSAMNGLPQGFMLQQSQQNGLIQQQNLLRELLLADAAQKLLGASLNPSLMSAQGVMDAASLNSPNLLLNNPALLNVALLNTLLSNQISQAAANQSNNSAVANQGAGHESKPKSIASSSKRESSKPKESKKRHRAPAAHSDSDAEEDSVTEYNSSHSSDEVDGHHKRVHHDPELMQGERRLTIQFDSYGTRGVVPQTFGRGSCIIPDGLCGRHTLYGESWFFSVKHETYDKESGLACVTWSMKSLASNQNLSRTETLAEARKRELHGRTIANQVVKKALEMRAQELEARLALEQNETWRLHLKGKIDALRPARFTQGPLAFGLHHKAVQDRMKELLQTSDTETASTKSSDNA